MGEAMANVFGCAELFELILLHLPQKDLLLAQVVCVIWKETIRVSPKLQQKLFFESTTSLGQRPELNPLLQKLFPWLFKLEECPKFGFMLAELPDYRDMISVQDIREYEWFRDGRRRNAVLREDASWRKMYAVQPPAPIGKVVKGGGCDAYEYIDHGVIEPPFQHLQDKGARMGLIYDIVLQELVGTPEANAHIEWHMFPFSRANGFENDEEDEEEQEEQDKVLESSITIYVGFPCHCDCRHRNDEKFDATPLQVAPCHGTMLKWATIVEAPL
jgi:hypothetical protein